MTKHVAICKCMSYAPNLPKLALPEFAADHFTSTSTRQFLISHPMDRQEVEQLVKCFQWTYLFVACEHEMRRAGFGGHMAPVSYTKPQLASLMVMSRWFTERQRAAVAMIDSWEAFKPFMAVLVDPDTERIIILYCGVVTEHTRRTRPRLPWVDRWNYTYTSPC